MTADKVKHVKLTDDLVQKYGITDVLYDSKQIEVDFRRLDGKDDTITIPILEYAHDTIQQLDSLVNGSMSSDAFTHLKYHLTLELSKIWEDIQNSSRAGNDSNSVHEANQEKENEKSQIKIAFDTVKKEAHKLFIDEYGKAHIALIIDNHLQIFPIDSNLFKDWYRLFIYEKDGIILDSETINKLCSLARAYAASSKYGEQINLSLRTASTVINNQLEWLYDLTNKNWEFIRITSNGWSIEKNKIIFRRYSNQQPQLYPAKECEPGIFDKFMKLINIKADDEEGKLLLKCYIISLFIPDIQKVVLMLHGSQGSAKSSLEELIKMLVDPSILKTLTFPRDVNEFLQQLSHNYVVFYDNVSKIPEWISNLFCRAVTGSASSKRQLYTDDDDVIRSFKRCVGFNGINLGATKADLLDRGLITKLEEIEPKNRRKPEDIWNEFEELRPQLLGYIFDILVKVLNRKNNGLVLNLNGLPRMSEFAEYGEMISRAMGYDENAFISAYYKNIELQSEEVIESSDVARCLIYMMFEKYGEKNNDNRSEWVGTPTQLYNEIKNVADTNDQLNIDTKGKYFPKSAKVLSRRIHEIAPNLKSIGLEVREHRDDRKRIVIIRKLSS